MNSRGGNLPVCWAGNASRRAPPTRAERRQPVEREVTEIAANDGPQVRGAIVLGDDGRSHWTITIEQSVMSGKAVQIVAIGTHDGPVARTAEFVDTLIPAVVQAVRKGLL